jgi:hypothetical protein
MEFGCSHHALKGTWYILESQKKMDQAKDKIRILKVDSPE